MSKISRWSVPIVILGSVIAVSATLLHYTQAHRAGVPGGYSALWIGALAIGCLTGGRLYFSAPPQERSALSSAAWGASSALLAAGALLATLTWAFGS